MIFLILATYFFGHLLGGSVAFIGLSVGIIYAINMLLVYKRYDLLCPIIGGTMDATAMASNHLQMPVYNPPPDSLDASHVLMTASTKFPLLCDIVPITSKVVVSFGDIIVIFGWGLVLLYMYFEKRNLL